MADKFKPRNLSPIMQIWRNFLLGRTHTAEKSALRYSPFLAARTQPPPNLPEGYAHKLSANPYCLRDGRREVKPPEVIVTNVAQKQIAAGSSADKSVSKGKKPVTPGKYWEWD